MDPIDQALLLAEKAEHQGRCPSCHYVVDDLGHKQSCPHDAALVARGFTTRRERDAARLKLEST